MLTVIIVLLVLGGIGLVALLVTSEIDDETLRK